MIIKVFGEQAQKIDEGDIFEAQITSVEGRKVVNLILQNQQDD